MTRKLTPAEALECLRDRRAVDRVELSSTMFYDRWGTFDHAVWSAIAALEEAMAQKPPAEQAPVVDIEPKTFVVVSPGAPCRFTERVIVRRFDEEKPAAPVPSDEEIVQAINQCVLWQDKVFVQRALSMLARRIGVQGVPQ